MKIKETALGGITNNPVFVLGLGLCPLIATSTDILSALTMGLATMAVLIFSNLFISLLKNIIPNEVRLPAYIVIIATFVTLIQLVMERFLPNLYFLVESFIKLIVVNCLLFARAEGFARKKENSVVSSLIDALSMGLGFVFAITLLGATRQFLAQWLNLSIFSAPTGGFLAFGLLMALFNALYYYLGKRRTA